METVEHLIVGAGPAGLRAGQVLAEAGRETLVVEKQTEIGPKTCAGGLTPKTVAILRGLGLPEGAGLARVGQVAFAPERPVTLDPDRTTVVTLSRRELGRYQVAWTRAAGAEVQAGCPARELDLAGKTALIGGTRLRWRHLIGADGSDSAVRRALRLPSPRVYFAAEYNLRGVRLEPLRVECDDELGGGYFWVFPHCDYTSVGAVACKHVVGGGLLWVFPHCDPPAVGAVACKHVGRPPPLRAYLDARLKRLDLAGRREPLEGATLEVDFHGLHFAGCVHLAGDAAGVPSALTAEGIYSALLTGEAVARKIIDPAYSSPRVARWLRVKRRHDRFAAFLRMSSGRAIALPLLHRLARARLARKPMTDWFLAG